MQRKGLDFHQLFDVRAVRVLVDDLPACYSAVEIQIRTHQMNEHAELGVAAHWRYQEGGPTDPAFDNKIAVMRQLLESTSGWKWRPDPWSGGKCPRPPAD